MAALRRHPYALGSVCAGALVCLALWSASPASLLFYWNEGYTPLDPQAASDIQTLRTDAGLDDNALAIANLSDAQAEAVLAAVRAWYESNLAGWRERNAAIAAQRGLIAVYGAEISNGTDRRSDYVAAERALATARSDYETQLAVLRQTALASITEGQRSAIETVRAGRSLPMPYCALGLDETQKLALVAASTRYQQRLLGADAEGRQSIESDYAGELRSAIGSANIEALNNLRSYLTPASERVVTAVQKVLPVASEG